MVKWSTRLIREPLNPDQLWSVAGIIMKDNVHPLPCECEGEGMKYQPVKLSNTETF